MLTAMKRKRRKISYAIEISCVNDYFHSRLWRRLACGGETIKTHKLENWLIMFTDASLFSLSLSCARSPLFCVCATRNVAHEENKKLPFHCCASSSSSLPFLLAHISRSSAERERERKIHFWCLFFFSSILVLMNCWSTTHRITATWASQTIIAHDQTNRARKTSWTTMSKDIRTRTTNRRCSRMVRKAVAWRTRMCCTPYWSKFICCTRQTQSYSAVCMRRKVSKWAESQVKSFFVCLNYYFFALPSVSWVSV